MSTPITIKRRKMEDDKQEVRLKVGESNFTTTMETLKGSSKLQKLVEREDQNAEGEYFIDRDGDMFKYILQYLRSKVVKFPPDFSSSEVLLKEAEFYEIEELKKALESGAGKPEVVFLTIMITKNEMDIALQKEENRKQWETLFKPYAKDSDLTFNVRPPTNERFDGAVLFYTDYTFQDVLLKQCECNYLFSTTTKSADFRLVNKFFKVGFSLTGLTSRDNATRFGKTYDIIKEMIFRRIKPVLGN